MDAVFADGLIAQGGLEGFDFEAQAVALLQAEVAVFAVVEFEGEAGGGAVLDFLQIADGAQAVFLGKTACYGNSVGVLVGHRRQ